MWSTGVPNGNVNVLIDNGNPLTSAVLLDISASVDNLTIDSDDRLGIGGTVLTVSGGTMTVLGQLGGTGTISGSGNVLNQGFIVGPHAATLTIGIPVTNQGTIVNPRKRRDRESRTQILLTGGLTNTGTLAPGGGALINITGPFTNFSGTTLTGGTYKVDRGSLYGVPCTLQFTNANVVTNSATVIIGPRAQIIDQYGNDAFRNFANNTSGANFVLLGRSLAPFTDFSNAGRMEVRGNFQVNSYTQTAGLTKAGLTLTTTYTQTGGTALLWYLLAPGGTTIQAGKFFGVDIKSAVTSSGSVTAGPSLKKSGTLKVTAYTQNAAGSLNIGIRSTTQYGQLAASNGASLNGTLNIKLVNSFVPAIGDSFTIITGSAITGKFATIKGLSINGSEHFEIAYNPTNVTLTVVSGAE